jgi:UDP-2-acetamido-3-amino-2,3-dideoxy-glucuronate N-acetyltransferase
MQILMGPMSVARDLRVHERPRNRVRCRSEGRTIHSPRLKDTAIHPTAVVEDGASIGAGSRVWHHAHVRGGATIGTECVVGKSAYIGAAVAVGNRCKIQNNAMLFEGSTLADGVFVGPGAQLANDRFPRAVTPDGALKGSEDWTLGHVTVEEGASIGAGAIVIPDARIGAWAMVGAGAVVTRDVAPHELVAGNPARHVGFVCTCGRRLAREGATSTWRCGECGRTFDLAEGPA